MDRLSTATGELVDVDTAIPERAVRHAWNSVQAVKATAFRQRADRLLLKLRDILAAEMVGSAVGRTPERLQAGVGSSFAGTFDFGAMSRILVKAKPGIELSDERRKRIAVHRRTLNSNGSIRLATTGPQPTRSRLTGAPMH